MLSPPWFFPLYIVCICMCLWAPPVSLDGRSFGSYHAGHHISPPSLLPPALCATLGSGHRHLYNAVRVNLKWIASFPLLLHILSLKCMLCRLILAYITCFFLFYYFLFVRWRCVGCVSPSGVTESDEASVVHCVVAAVGCSWRRGGRDESQSEK